MQFSLLTAAVAAVALTSSVSAEEERMVSIRAAGAGVLVRGSGSLSAQTCYGAPKAPWVHGHYPGWICGSKPSGGNFCGKPWGSYPSWGSGDLDFCDWPFAKYWPICRNSNGGGSTTTYTAVQSVTSTITTTQVVPTTTTVNGSPVTTTATATVTTTVAAAPTGCQNGFSQTFSNYTTVAVSGVYQGQTVGAATIDNPHYLTYGLVDTLQDCENVCNSIAACTFINLYKEYNSTIKDSYAQGKLTCAVYSACSGTSMATNYGGQDDPTYITGSSGYCKCSGNGSCN